MSLRIKAERPDYKIDCREQKVDQLEGYLIISEKRCLLVPQVRSGG
jgi:hypothetical protein